MKYFYLDVHRVAQLIKHLNDLRRECKVDLLDKKGVPPGMHVSFSSEWAPGRITDIAPDGTFEFTTLAPGIYSLNVGVNWLHADRRLAT